MRPAPKNLPPEIKPVPKENLITQLRKYELITPLFGGGVEPGEDDPITVLRGTAIRGHLRFWWRACRAGSFNSVAKMKEVEDIIFGSASTAQEGKPSKINIRVEI
ncbi:MAG: CRISPR-associated protein, partial [bacterium]